MNERSKQTEPCQSDTHQALIKLLGESQDVGLSRQLAEDIDALIGQSSDFGKTKVVEEMEAAAASFNQRAIKHAREEGEEFTQDLKMKAETASQVQVEGGGSCSLAAVVEKADFDYLLQALGNEGSSQMWKTFPKAVGDLCSHLQLLTADPDKWLKEGAERHRLVSGAYFESVQESLNAARGLVACLSAAQALTQGNNNLLAFATKLRGRGISVHVLPRFIQDKFK